MALLNQSVQVNTQLGKLFETLRQGQAPDKFTREFLKDIGFKSSNHHAFVPLLKGLGFLTSDGTPTQRYKEFLDHTKWRKVIAEAIREAYGDIFIIKSKPTNTDRKLIAGKYKSTYNLSENAADRAAGTFLSLLKLADEGTLYGEHEKKTAESKESKSQQKLGGTPPAGTEVAATPSAPIHTAEPASTPVGTPINNFSGLHYNIQIHLPATKDIEVYNAIFKSIREHLID